MQSGSYWAFRSAAPPEVFGEPGECPHGVPDHICCPDCQLKQVVRDLESEIWEADFYAARVAELVPTADALAAELEGQRICFEDEIAQHRVDKHFQANQITVLEMGLELLLENVESVLEAEGSHVGAEWLKKELNRILEVTA